MVILVVEEKRGANNILSQMESDGSKELIVL